MRKLRVSELIEEIEMRIDKLQEKPPAEINNLNDVSSIPGMHRYSRIVHANMLLLELSNFLGSLKKAAKDGVPIESVIPITVACIERDIIFLTAYGLNDTTQLLKRICEVLRDVDNIDEYVDIVNRSRVYLNRLGAYGWIDTLLIHAAEMELVYDLMFPPQRI